MKKTSLLVALSAVALSGLLLSGCGMFRSHKAWDTAQQESPLEIPPTLDRPSTSDALVIPAPGANLPTSSGAVARVNDGNGQITDGFVVADSVDNTYRKVGDVLQGGSLGQVVSHDDAAHGYNLNVPSSIAQQSKKKGFFGRLFSHDKSDASGTSGSAYPVQVSIGGSGTNASEIRAQGNAAAVAKVIDTLKSRLGS
ncbi:hypothetical protein B0E46_16145 [Rhodanobacter sp. B04]|uniref:hypothetical protein n=1 Tax=Rhodanobacter sp. B04 TaxID=1945860 RepID=UPI000984EB5E|nr:hypothetical protein [Rhodanobacter sp. B04]OOG61501.1 hypothetical protein B0E46_16145 [Rhodanobacter sp. B04]